MIPLSYCQPAQQPLEALPDEYQAAVERFGRFLAVRHLSVHTRRLYVGAVERWFRAGGVPGHVDGERLARFLAGRRATCATATVNMDIKALRAFYRWQRSWGDATDADLVKLPRQRTPPERLVRHLTEAQVGEVLGSLPLDTYVGLRDYTIIRTLFDTGLRASELAKLELGDLLDDGYLFVTGKGGKDRYVPITDALRGVLNGYLRARAGLRPGRKAAFWLRGNARPLRNGRSIWEIVSRRIWAAVGVRSGMHQITRAGQPWQGHYPHELRASFATALLRRGMPLTAIAQMMGHADVATTAHYLGVDLDQLRAAAKKHPRALRQS